MFAKADIPHGDTLAWSAIDIKENNLEILENSTTDDLGDTKYTLTGFVLTMSTCTIATSSK